MAETLRIAEAFIAREYATFRYIGDDGYPTARHFDVIVVTSTDGRQFALPNGRKVQDDDGLDGAVRTYDADKMLHKVQARGTIQADLWVLQEPQESYEERFGPFGTEWQLEQRDRADWSGGLYR